MADRGLVRAVLASAGCALVSVALAGVLPWPAAVVAWVLLWVAGRAALGATPARADLLRRGATVAVLLLAAVLLPAAVTAGGSLPARAILGPLLVSAQVLQALTWRGRRELQVALVCATGLLVLGASYAPDVLVGVPLLAGWASCLVAGLLAHRMREREGVDAVASPTGAAVGSDRSLVTVTGLAVALGLVAFLLIPVPPANGLRRSLSSAFGAPDGLPSRGALGPAAYSGRVDLRVRGDLSTRPMAEVPDSSPTLWRGQVYDTYDGSSWASDVTGPPAAAVPGPPFVVGTARSSSRRDAVTVLAGDGSIFAPGDVSRLDLGGLGSGVVLRDDLGNLRILRPAGVGALTRYAVTSDPVPVLTDTSAATGAADEADPRWRGLPSSLPARVVDLARRLVADTTGRAAEVLAVQGYLGRIATYRTDSPVPGPGQDAVDQFLFVDRTGFCEQFASAETVLLRAVGIPARLVSGLAYGVPHGPGRRLYREADQHAWVEVWMPGLGWTSSDPTAGAQLATGGAGGQSLRQRLAGTVLAGLRALQRVPGGRPALALLLLAGTFAVATVLRLRGRRPVAAPAVRGVAAGPATAGRPALAAFLRLDGRLGWRGRGPGESLAEMRQRLGVSGEGAGAFVVVERECYAATLPPEGPAAAAVLDRLSVPGG